MARLLVVHHSPTALTRELADAVIAGGRDEAIVGVDVISSEALKTTADQVNETDGLALVTPANFGYMSGALKHFFDSTFLEIGGDLSDDGSAASAQGGRTPFGLVVHGRYDVSGAVRAVTTIAGALPWRQAAPVLEVTGDLTDQDRESAYELGATISALIGE